MTCFLGIDYGTKRIGLAISDADATVASPLATLEVRGTLTEQVQAVLEHARSFDVGAFVVGLPLNMDDSEGAQARISRRFGATLARTTRMTVHYFDERLSTHHAQETLRAAGLSRKRRKTRVDRLAAQVMLQGFLDAQ